MAVTASFSLTVTGCVAVFRLFGDISIFVFPVFAASERMDNLWKTTCFEIFWQPIGQPGYVEFNLSPSGRWASYDFDSFREGMRDAPVEAISIACSHSSARGGGELVLKASIAANLPAPAHPAGGGIQLWALAFPPGPPEFHSEACRQWIVER